VDILLDGDFRIGRVQATVPVMQPGETRVFRNKLPVYDASGTGSKTTWTAVGGWHDFMALMHVGNCFRRKRTSITTASAVKSLLKNSDAQTKTLRMIRRVFLYYRPFSGSNC
jgi:hypothetical protein